MSNTNHVFKKVSLKTKFALGALALGSAAAASAAYPERPITMVVSYPPGGTVDLVARLMAPELEKELGQTVIVDNKGGARSEEHTSELQSLMRTSYAGFSLKTKTTA